MDDGRFDGDNDLLSSVPSSNSNTDPFHHHDNNDTNTNHHHVITSLDSFAPSSMPQISPTAQPSRSPKIFDRFDDSSSDDDFSFSTSTSTQSQNGAIHNAGKKLDYMIQLLDRKLTKDNNNNNNINNNTLLITDSPSPLPEFIGNGGGTGIFKLPIRSAVRLDRPPCLEVRPHPLRETQIGCGLKTIVCTESQLWAGGESGMRFWNFGELYSTGQAEVGLEREGDEKSAPFRESVITVDVFCLVGDDGKRVVWSGHVDGKIRCWRMDQKLGGNGFKECFSWQAHRGPVLSMAMTSYGDLWSGSENGVLKIWPWEALEKALSLTSEERHTAVLVVERSYIDLKSQVTINGVCYMFTSDVKYLIVDHSTAKVWSAGLFSFALWDSRTRELLKVFNSDGQVENWADMSSMQDLTMEDEAKLKFIPFLKKEKAQPQPSFGFFQRSRNAILGAADAVRRAAVKGAFGEDNQRTEAMVSTIDGTIWTGCTSGLLVHWDGNGNRLQEFQYHSFAVQCLCTFGSRIWVGYMSGTVQILDLDGNLIGGWIAHGGSITKMAVGSGYLFTLAHHGGVRGWNITSPGPIDNLLRSELSHKEFLYTRQENLRILAGTWNVAEGRASPDSLISWLVSGVSDVDIFVVGFQELEMGAGALAMSAARETVGLEGSSVGQWWLDMIDSILDEGSTFDRVGSRQLAGLLIAVWVRSDLKSHVGDIDAAAVPCGFGRAIGNKGAVGLKMRIYDRFFCFVNCHFAAHLEAVNRRNADFDHVYRTMIFNRQSNLFNTSAVGISSAVQLLRGANGVGVHAGEVLPELSEGDMVVFLGDFNYRLDGISYDEARDFISQRCFDWLRERDQLHVEMEAGKVFQGMREAIIRFPPTYKFEKHMPGLAGYDSGEKKRIPAWCDRILYRDSCVSGKTSECSLDCPVVGSITQYEACMDVTDSDHKPVRCIFNVDVALVDHSIRRQEFRQIIDTNARIQSILEDLLKVPEAIVSTNNIIFQNNDTSVLRISNKSRSGKALFTIICEGEANVNEDGIALEHIPRGSFGLPRWLGVNPAKGIIEPDHTVEVSVHHQDFHTLEEYVDGVPCNSWCEDTRDKEVMLVVNIQGSCTTEVTSHRIRVRHCFPAKTKKSEPITDNSEKVTGKLLHRSNIQHLNTSIDMFDQLRKLHTP